MSTLNVYKASAGSGKTFTLVSEYIKRLVRNPEAYRHILAVTFTNKATEEMKTRILSQLYRVGYDIDGDEKSGKWKGDNFLQKVMETEDDSDGKGRDAGGASPASDGGIFSASGSGEKAKSDGAFSSRERRQQVRANCRTALNLMLNDYTNFRITTIDSFFQSVLRNLAYELHLTPNLRIELNDDKVVSEAVDAIIDQLEPSDEKLKWLMNYIRRNIEEDKGWNVINKIKDFGKNVLHDDYRTHSARIDRAMKNADDFESQINALYKLRDELIDEMRGFALEYLRLMRDGITDFKGMGIDEEMKADAAEYDGAWGFWKYGSTGVGSYFKRLYKTSVASNRNSQKNIFVDANILKARVVNGLDDVEAWTGTLGGKKPSPMAVHAGFVESDLIPLLNRAEDKRKEARKAYYTIEAIIPNINEMRLMKSISDKVKTLNSESGQFQLSDTQYMLREMMDESDSPFIYEKIGTRIDDIMIDEFQDTSRLQWENFKVLLKECLSRSSENSKETGNVSSNDSLIVGDVKQSIYRWRNGDWRILNNMNSEQPTDGMTTAIKTLKANFRSAANIILFNNYFFRRAASLERARIAEKISEIDSGSEKVRQIEMAYSDVEQEVPEKKLQNKEGLVRISFVVKNQDKEETDDENDNENSNEKDNSEDEKVYFKTLADTVVELLDKGVAQKDIAILVRSNIPIPKIAKYFNNPDNCGGKKINIVSGEAFLLSSSITVNRIVDGLRFVATPKEVIVREVARQSLGEEFINDIENCRSLPLYSLAETIFEKIQERPQSNASIADESAYICSFFDLLADFIVNDSADLNRFLMKWDEKLKDTAIEGGTADGVRIMTIHKSKGLEFDNVILPMDGWNTERFSQLWCDCGNTPFSKLGVATVNCSDKLKYSYFDKEWAEEILQNCVDNLNMLYVAFTRAGHNLFVICEENYKESKKDGIQRNPDSSNRGSLVKEVVGIESDEIDWQIEGNPESKETVVYSFGKLKVPEKSALEDISHEKESPSAANAANEKVNDAAEKVNAASEKESAPAVNVFTAKPSALEVEVTTYPSQAQFMQSNESQRFINNEYVTEQFLFGKRNGYDLLFGGHEEEASPNSQYSYIDRGKLLHELMSRIKTADDLDRQLLLFANEGGAGDKKEKEEAAQLIRQRITEGKGKQWFSPKMAENGWRLFNECSILSWEQDESTESSNKSAGLSASQKSTASSQGSESINHQQVRRPDRVMTCGKEAIVVDYKFGKENQKYHTQVSEYMALLLSMGYEEVKGFLWYVLTDKVVEVKQQEG